MSQVSYLHLYLCLEIPLKMEDEHATVHFRGHVSALFEALFQIHIFRNEILTVSTEVRTTLDTLADKRYRSDDLAARNDRR